MKNQSLQILANFITFLPIVRFCIISFIFICQAQSQCSNGFELACVWYHDEKSALRWLHKTDPNGDNIVELKDCQYPDCGIGAITSPWLDPRGQDEWISLHYKIYGTSNVYLRLYLRTAEGGSGQYQIFSQTGNYAHQFPTEWSRRDVRIPAIRSKHRLILKAHTPFKEAYVAVKDIKLTGTTLVTSTLPTPTEPEEEETTMNYNRENDYVAVTTDDFEDTTEYEEQNEVFPFEEKYIEEREEKFQALETNFIGVEDLKRGYTRVIEPNICKYR